LWHGKCIIGAVVNETRKEKAMRTKSILMIDHSSFVARLSSEWLKDYALTWVSSRRQAEEMLNRKKYDLVMTSLDLSDSEGPETFYYLNQLVPSTPLAILKEAHYRGRWEKDLPQGLAANMDRVNLSEENLRQMIEKVLGSSLREPAGTEL